MTSTGARPALASDADFDYIRKLVADRAAIVLDDTKLYLVESRLLPLARAEGVTSLAALVGRLRSRGPSDPLVTKVVEAMTTNETSFFRDPPVFETLRTSILPDLIAKRSSARRLRIWSAAASTGQEAYSIVILLRESFPELSGWRVEVLGTDLSTAVLAKARAGVYTRFEVARGLSSARVQRWFRPAAAGYQLDRSIIESVQFRPLNLVTPGPLPASDLILLRNVLIYFDLETRRRVMARVRAALEPGSWLLLGTAENPDDAGLQRVQFGHGVVYQPTGPARAIEPPPSFGSAR
jgi:chemotaxis protein methyltransferase CheR